MPVVKQDGTSLVEVLVVLALLGLIVAGAVVRFEAAATPVRAGALEVAGFFRQARARALATTSAYRVFADSDRLLAAEWAASCTAPSWTSDPALALELTEGVRLGATAWTVCFSSRGTSADNVTVSVTHPEYGSRQIEVMLGGSTRILP
jgi:prepilin-type N-terminal cleavage/methylation domain-containing protein